VLKILPFNEFILKINNLCNLNCSYCYEYNLADDSYKRQASRISDKVIYQTAIRIREHCYRHNLKRINICFHGGEPLLGGISHLLMLTTTIKDIFKNSPIKIHFLLQSNGLLFTPEIGDFLLKENIKIGISLDGPPAVNNIYRVDHKGNPTGKLLEERLKLLTGKYKKIFSGFLCVININTDPIEVFKYLLSFNPPGLDFQCPLNNHNNLPIGKELDKNATPYGDWLIKNFDYWFYNQYETRIRIFNSLIEQIFGGKSLAEGLGLDPITLIILRPNGNIESLDALKSSFIGATYLRYNIFEHSFDTVAHDPAVRFRQIGLEGLCQKCKECPIVKICGGGYLPHRYSVEKGFSNPSVYCTDLQKLINHIYESICQEIDRLKSTQYQIKN
jgi:uncharacterized protein